MIEQDFAKLRVLVIGDIILDSYASGTSTRSCPDAPDAPVIDEIVQTFAPGGAANTALNCKSLGAGSVTLIGEYGYDPEGDRLAGLLMAGGVELCGVRDGQTAVKGRIVSNGKLVARIDRRAVSDSETVQNKVIARLTGEWSTADVVIVTDHGYGVMGDRVIQRLAELMVKDHKFLVVDAKNLRKYRDCKPSAICPNWRQFKDMVGLANYPEPSGRREWIDGCANMAFARSGASIIAVTLDAEGALTLDQHTNPALVEAQQIDNPHPSGAGDTFTSAFGLGLASGMSRFEAGEIAQRAAEIACRNPGTHAVGIDELEAVIKPDEPRKPITVLTTGCFDVLHAGHVALLTAAKTLGDRLIVGINGDASVSRLKPGRPVNTAFDRIKVLSALACVDGVVTFREDTPERLIRDIRPDIFVKASDYAVHDLPEAEAVRECGGKVVIIPFVDGYSTTEMIERLKGQSACSPKPDPRLTRSPRVSR